MRFISTNLHGIFDYVVGAYLIAMPWLFGFAFIGGPATWVPVTIGVGVIAYSLLTDYEWGVWKRIPMRAHLILDVLAGLTLLFSVPWFGFFDQTWWLPQLTTALVLIFFGAMTRRTPQSVRPRFRAPRQFESI